MVKNGEDAKGTNWGNDAGVSVLKWIASQKGNAGFVNLDDNNVMSKFGDGSVASLNQVLGIMKPHKRHCKNNLGVAVYPTIRY